MTEFVGTEDAIALQRTLYQRRGVIAAERLLANGGRILNVLEPANYGWDRLKADVARDKVVALTRVPREPTLARLKQDYGDGYDFPYWEAFVGTHEDVLPACDALCAAVALPQGWTCVSSDTPDEATIAAAQALNAAAGVAPMPRYYLQSKTVPSLLTTLWREDGTLAACASGSMRYHPNGPMGGWLFAGGVSVLPECRGSGFGRYVNAALLRDSQAAFRWSHALEQARADNAASVAMIESCGLVCEPGTATIAITPKGAYVTR